MTSTIPEQAREDALKRFVRHDVTIFQDDGLRRHIKFSEGNSNCYRFDLITYPGGLLMKGDIGTFVFERIADMFEFFRGEPGEINPGYWREKMVASCTPALTYTYESIISGIQNHLEVDENFKLHHGDEERQEKILEALPEIQETVEFYVCGDNTEMGSCGDRVMSILSDHGIRTDDFWEYRFTEYSYRYLYALHAIVWGINAYDKEKAHNVPVADSV